MASETAGPMVHRTAFKIIRDRTALHSQRLGGSRGVYRYSTRNTWDGGLKTFSRNFQLSAVVVCVTAMVGIYLNTRGHDDDDRHFGKPLVSFAAAAKPDPWTRVPLTSRKPDRARSDLPRQSTAAA